MPLFDKSLPYYKEFIKEVAQFLESENVPITAFGKGENQ
ncbi:conserved domain protein [Staphylococcus capitis VCU116]|nr:conserved domain protein [Staphylococcus capitis VCU116]